MTEHSMDSLRRGNCIFINTVLQGSRPLVINGDGKYIVFGTGLEAQREIADYQIIRLQ